MTTDKSYLKKEKKIVKLIKKKKKRISLVYMHVVCLMNVVSDSLIGIMWRYLKY